MSETCSRCGGWTASQKNPPLCQACRYGQAPRTCACCAAPLLTKNRGARYCRPCGYLRPAQRAKVHAHQQPKEVVEYAEN